LREKKYEEGDIRKENKNKTERKKKDEGKIEIRKS
jgi:hypothetical protein